MSELPAGWQMVPLSALGEYINGFPFKPSDWGLEGRPIIRIQNLSDPTKRFNRTRRVVPDRVVVRPGDLLVSWSATLEAYVWRGEEAVLNQHIFRVLPTQTVSDTRFLFWALKEAIADLARGEHAHGSTMKHVNRGPFLAHEVALPPSADQQLIAAALDFHMSRLDAATATLERAQRNLKRYRASVLKAAVEGLLVPTEAALARAEGRSYEPASVLLDRILAERRARWEASGKKGNYEEPVAPDTAGLPELPEGWRWGSLPQIGELGRGKSKHRPRNDPRLLGGPHPFIQTGDVRKSGGRITRYSSTYSDLGLAQSRMWPAGTICITIAANIAETGILGFEACFPDSVVGLLVTGPSEVAEFVEYFIRTAREELSRYAPATAQKNINLEILEQVVVPLPPLAEIGRIVDEISRRLTVADAAETSVVADLTRLERLRGSVLRAAFRGELG